MFLFFIYSTFFKYGNYMLDLVQSIIFKIETMKSPIFFIFFFNIQYVKSHSIIISNFVF